MLLIADNLSKTFHDGNILIEAVKDTSLTVEKGELLCIEGRSGSGKTTLLNMLGLVTSIDRGKLLINDIDAASMSSKLRSAYRNRFIGHIVQDFALLEDETALYNVMLPMIYARLSTRNRTSPRIRAQALLKSVGLGTFANQKVRKLSGGERQRVAIARAFANHPQLVLADEPTGALDTVTGESMIRLLMTWCIKRQASLILVTHDPTYAALFNRRYIIERGTLSPLNTR